MRWSVYLCFTIWFCQLHIGYSQAVEAPIVDDLPYNPHWNLSTEAAQQLRHNPSSQVRLRMLLDLAGYYLRHNPDTAWTYAQEAHYLVLASKKTRPSHITSILRR
ncbi:hypothetical protein [Eisenibacter elegans]|jgi:hypothetical protein|uniref:hypothetical protein n=1 Tax=Eisenibacter elegans TaxID=997 RepID=UPI000426247C|nr:hypothetical protein [Eisenibacter elegans]